MAMMPCKQCKKEVERTAKTCPHCGVTNPAVSTKQTVLGVAALAAIVVAVVVACSDSSTPKSTEAAAPAPATAASSTPPTAEVRPNFGFDSQEFRTRFNAVAKEVGKEWLIQQPLALTQGSKKDTWTFIAPGETPVVGTVDKQSGNMESVMATLTGGDQEKSIKAFASLHMIANALTKNASRDDVSAALMSAVKKAMAGSGGDPVRETIGRVQISAKALQGVGVMVSYSPAE